MVKTTIKFPIYGKGGKLVCHTLISSSDISRITNYTWNLMGRGYIKARINKKDIYLHRYILNQTDPSIIVDHINGDKLDNRQDNLRFATKSQNSFNRKKSADKSSIYKGVSFNKNKNMWQSYTKMNGVKNVIGYFDTQKKAALEYDKLALVLYGDFFTPNFKPSKDLKFKPKTIKKKIIK
jgi:hypothetical protein